jgi:hypothetical protein
MQRTSFLIFWMAALYVSSNALATPPVTASTKPIVIQQEAALSTSAVAATWAPVIADHPAPHIALILPLKTNSAELARAATIVQQGFQAAATIADTNLPVRTYPCADEATEVVTQYRQALVNGARAVAGPLTRNGVTALASYPNSTIPTLALNVTEAAILPRHLYLFGLPSEQEAKQIAQLATLAGLKHATIISTGSTLSKRLATAFSEEWLRQGGTITADVLFNSQKLDTLAQLPVAPWPKGTHPATPASASTSASNRVLPNPVAPGNMVFLATDHAKARLIRPYLNPSLPVYATSLLFKGNANKLPNFDLNEINFVDMPWLLQPDHPAVMIYPRSETALDAELDRLYALGIDAYRLIGVLLNRQASTNLSLDGVTGQIHLLKQQFIRQPSPAFFKQGLGLTEETLANLNAAKLAARAAEASGQASSAPIAENH